MSAARLLPKCVQLQFKNYDHSLNSGQRVSIVLCVVGVLAPLGEKSAGA